MHRNQQRQNRNAQKKRDAAASAQTAYSCRDVLRITDGSGTDDSREEAPAATIGLREIVARISDNWLGY